MRSMQKNWRIREANELARSVLTLIDGWEELTPVAVVRFFIQHPIKFPIVLALFLLAAPLVFVLAALMWLAGFVSAVRDCDCEACSVERAHAIARERAGWDGTPDGGSAFWFAERNRLLDDIQEMWPVVAEAIHYHNGAETSDSKLRTEVTAYLSKCEAKQRVTEFDGA